MARPTLRLAPRLLALVGLVSLGDAAPARADEAPTRPEKHESDAKPPSSVRLPTALGGLGFTAGFWALNAGTSFMFPDAPGIDRLRVPVAGPWLAIANNSCDGECGFTFYFSTIYYVVSGLAQAGGLGIALESLLIPTAAPGERPPAPAPRPGPVEPPREGAPPPPAPAPQPGNGKPLFYLPMPMTVGQSGLGVQLGGVF